ncbi:MAG: ABC transporter permease subunit [Chloroflexi bacterium]|nr:ABC transporter permease subunit [Chloroflexota bacterium]
MTVESPRYPKRTWAFSPHRPSVTAVLVGTAVTVLIVSSWLYLGSIPNNGRSVISADSLSRSIEFIEDLTGSHSSSSFWQRNNWGDLAQLAGDTLAMSVLAAFIAGIAAIILIPFAASNVLIVSANGPRRVFQVAIYGVIRGLFIFTRSVPELLWALIIIFVFTPGIFAGALALAVHNLGVIGRLGADIVEDAEKPPLQALRSTGAGPLQTYLIGILPQIARQFLTFQIYRWEVIIRTTAVVGFVAASGLGYQLRLDISFFRYKDVGQLLLVYILIVWIVDAISTLARRAVR